MLLEVKVLQSILAHCLDLFSRTVRVEKKSASDVTLLSFYRRAPSTEEVDFVTVCIRQRRSSWPELSVREGSLQQV